MDLAIYSYFNIFTFEITLTDTFVRSFSKAYTRGDSMNGTPTASWQRLCVIDRVELKVTKSSIKS